MTDDTTDTRVSKALRDATAELFDGCATPFELAAALTVVMSGPLALEPTLVLELHTDACVRNGWEPS